MSDPVSAPSHYTQQVPGWECIDFTQHMPFARGSAMKYLWRAGHKGVDTEYQDLSKARNLIDIELQRVASLTYPELRPTEVPRSVQRRLDATRTDEPPALDSLPVERWHE